MSWGDCDFAGKGQAEGPYHGDCIKMAGHRDTPHQDYWGREWFDTPPPPKPNSMKEEMCLLLL